MTILSRIGLVLQDFVGFEQPGGLAGVELVLDLAGFACGLGFGWVFWIEGETSGEDAFDDGEFVAAAMAFRLRGVEVRQGDLAERFLFVGAPCEEGLRGAVEAISVEFRGAVGVGVGHFDAGHDAGHVHFDGFVVQLKSGRGDGERVAAAVVRTEGLEGDALQRFFLIEGWCWFGKEKLITVLDFSSYIAGGSGIGFSIEGKCGEAWSGSAAPDGDEQVAEAVLNRLAGVDGLGDDLDGTEGFEAVGGAFQDEHCGTTRAVVGAPAIHQGEDVVRAVVVEIGACDVVVIRFDFRIDFLEGGLSEGKGWRRGVGEAGEGEQEEEGHFHGDDGIGGEWALVQGSLGGRASRSERAILSRRARRVLTFSGWVGARSWVSEGSSLRW